MSETKYILDTFFVSLHPRFKNATKSFLLCKLYIVLQMMPCTAVLNTYQNISSYAFIFSRANFCILIEKRNDGDSGLGFVWH